MGLLQRRKRPCSRLSITALVVYVNRIINCRGGRKRGGKESSKQQCCQWSKRRGEITESDSLRVETSTNYSAMKEMAHRSLLSPSHFLQHSQVTVRS